MRVCLIEIICISRNGKEQGMSLRTLLFKSLMNQKQYPAGCCYSSNAETSINSTWATPSCALMESKGLVGVPLILRFSS